MIIKAFPLSFNDLCINFDKLSKGDPSYIKSLPIMTSNFYSNYSQSFQSNFKD